jgi:hypothetical protein
VRIKTDTVPLGLVHVPLPAVLYRVIRINEPETDKPVQLAKLPEEGVPSAGVTSVGLVSVLLVSVSVVALPTKVSVLVGKVSVPVFEMLEIIGVVSVLLVNV